MKLEWDQLDWVDCGLPWDIPENKWGPRPTPTPEELQQAFGVSVMPSEGTSYIAYYAVSRRMAHRKFPDMPLSTARRIAAELGVSADFEKYIKAREANEWWHSHPRYLGWIQEQKNRSFVGRGLDAPGTIIQADNGRGGKYHFIGSALLCGDCRSLEDHHIVQRYAIVIDNGGVEWAY